MFSSLTRHCSCYVPLIKYILQNKVMLDYKITHFILYLYPLRGEREKKKIPQNEQSPNMQTTPTH